MDNDDNDFLRNTEAELLQEQVRIGVTSGRAEQQLQEIVDGMMAMKSTNLTAKATLIGCTQQAMSNQLIASNHSHRSVGEEIERLPSF